MPKKPAKPTPTPGTVFGVRTVQEPLPGETMARGRVRVFCSLCQKSYTMSWRWLEEGYECRCQQRTGYASKASPTRGPSKEVTDEILAFLRTHPWATTDRIAEVVKLHRTTVRTYMFYLRKGGVVSAERLNLGTGYLTVKWSIRDEGKDADDGCDDDGSEDDHGGRPEDGGEGGDGGVEGS